MLLFGELVLHQELEDVVPMAEKEQAYLSGAVTKAKGKSGEAQFIHFLQNTYITWLDRQEDKTEEALSIRRMIFNEEERKRLWKDPQPLEAVVKNTSLERELNRILNLRKRRVSMVALWSKATGHVSGLRNNLWCGVSHEVATDLYQVSNAQ